MAFCCYAQTLKIWPGVSPGSETWIQKERVVKDTPIGTVVFNVVTPTLTVYLPEPTKATGTGIIIAPGGAFVALAIGFGMRKQGTSSDHWIDEFYYWLEAQGFTRPRSKIIGEDMQVGYQQIVSGAMRRIRNPKAHANVQIDAIRAMPFLFLASLLMSKVDEALAAESLSAGTADSADPCHP